VIDSEILQSFPELFGRKKVNGREVNVEQTIAALTRELNSEIAAALSARRAMLQSPAPVREKYAWRSHREQLASAPGRRKLDRNC
jgi:malate synthase